MSDQKSEWIEDVERGGLYGRNQARPPDAVPHYCRCNHFNEHRQRCKREDGHLGDHVAPKMI